MSRTSTKEKTLTLGNALTGETVELPILSISPIGGDPLLVSIQDDDTENKGLEELKSDLVNLLSAGDAIMFSIAGIMRSIEQRRLYEGETDPKTGLPFTSMNKYMPYLLDELKTRAKLHKLSRRQALEYVALSKVFVDNLGIPAAEVMRLGPSHFTEIREALDYDPRTGEVKPDSAAREGKIGAETALKYVEELREAVDSGAEWRVQDLRDALDGERGVERRNVSIEWVKNYDGTYYIGGITVWDGAGQYNPLDSIPEPLARSITNKWGAMSNLDA